MKEAISGFEDARKSDIENKCLPPDLYDRELEEGKGLITSQPTTPSEDVAPPVSPNGVTAALEQVIAGTTPTTPTLINTSPQAVQAPQAAPSPSLPLSPTSPVSAASSPFRRRHGRQASLGMMMTSPSTMMSLSTWWRSLESTMSLIQEVWDGKTPMQDPELVKLTDSIVEKSTGWDKDNTKSGWTSPSGGAAPS